MSEKNERKGNDKQVKKKESILELNKYLDKAIRVKFQGGREASGILKGYDPCYLLYENFLGSISCWILLSTPQPSSCGMLTILTDLQLSPEI